MKEHAQEEWQRWEPLAHLSPKYRIESIINALDLFQVFMTPEDGQGKRARLFFEFDADLCTRTTSEYAAERFSMLAKQYGNEFFRSWSFFKVSNSSLIDWLHQESATITEGLPFEHYVIVGSNWVVDILDVTQPMIEILENDVQK